MESIVQHLEETESENFSGPGGWGIITRFS